MVVAAEDYKNHKVEINELGRLTFRATKQDKEYSFTISSFSAPIDVKQSNWCERGGKHEIFLRLRK